MPTSIRVTIQTNQMALTSIGSHHWFIDASFCTHSFWQMCNRQIDDWAKMQKTMPKMLKKISANRNLSHDNEKKKEFIKESTPKDKPNLECYMRTFSKLLFEYWDAVVAGGSFFFYCVHCIEHCIEKLHI